MLTAVMGALSIAFVQAQAVPLTPRSGVIEKLTAQTREQAVECGRRGPECAVVPYQLCPSDGRYAAVLVTPFSRVALAAAEANKAGRPLGRMGPASVNRWGISVHVTPTFGAGYPEPIERMEVRREGKVVQPVKATVGPVTLTSPDGRTQISIRGVFDFPVAAFEPSAAVQLVLVGPSGESRCTVERTKLEALR
jgi:hypothetical protein